MQALQIHAGATARDHIARNGLSPADISVIAGAAGGPKGLMLGSLDRFLFGEWLPQSSQPLDLVGASIGAWRMSSACMSDPADAFKRLEQDYVNQDYVIPHGQKKLTAHDVSEQFGLNLQAFFKGKVQEILNNPRYRLHIVTSRGRHILSREHSLKTPLGYLGAFASNAIRRKAMGAWLERVVFSSQGSPLPFAIDDFRTRQVRLDEGNFMDALQASCSIPFVLKAVHDIANAPPGAYWDGGITDYHLHLDYRNQGLVLYPHFQAQLVPGWLDKRLKWRHRSTHFLDTTILLSPRPEWVQKKLPNGKLPDRTDFARYGSNLSARTKVWNEAISASSQLSEEFEKWLEKPDVATVLPLL